MIGMKDARVPSTGQYDTVRTAEIIPPHHSRSKMSILLCGVEKRETTSFFPKKKRYMFVCRAFSATRRCKSSTQPDGGEVLAKRKNVVVSCQPFFDVGHL